MSFFQHSNYAYRNAVTILADDLKINGKGWVWATLEPKF